MNIAFIGLGAMGLPMASRLLAAGHQVKGHDLSDRHRAAFEAAGGQWPGSAAEALAGAELVWLMVVSGEQAHDALITQNQVQHLAPGTPVVVSCTQSAASAMALDAALQARGLCMVDAPVSGGVVGAEAGTLAIMVGAPTPLFEAVRPVLQICGQNLFHMGEQAGAGSTMKMINQLLCGVHIAVAAEAMQLAENAGLALPLVHQIVSVSAGNSWMWGNRGPRMLQDEPPVTSAVDIFVKDLGIVADEARRLKSGVPLASAALQLFLATSGQGHGKADDSQVIRAYRRMNRG
ncbi:MAG: hypothetical protein RIQ38_553 [Pseudomonadota bacterium]|jgi:3-hydroxyisobutyrate dehydrogenase